MLELNRYILALSVKLRMYSPLLCISLVLLPHMLWTSPESIGDAKILYLFFHLHIRRYPCVLVDCEEIGLVIGSTNSLFLFTTSGPCFPITQKLMLSLATLAFISPNKMMVPLIAFPGDFQPLVETFLCLLLCIIYGAVAMVDVNTDLLM